MVSPLNRWTAAWIQAVVVALFTYAVAWGATLSGLLLPETRAVSVFLLTGAIAGWLVLRWRLGWYWRRTTLDWAVLLWVGAFAASLVANQESWRRITLGLWFALVYVGLWYILYDLIANGALTREKIADALVIGGVIVGAIGYWQLQTWLFVELPLTILGVIPLQLPRLGSTLGNPNLLADMLLVVTPTAFALMLARRGVARLLYGLVALLGAVLLLLAYSRAAWGAAALAALVGTALLLSERGVLDPAWWVNWWETRSRLVQSELRATAISSVMLVLVIGFVAIYSLRGNSASLGLRTNIYGSAVTLFSERPVAGHGLFTFGRGLARLQSMPPYVPHSHAHSLPLNVAAELGVVGIVALLVSVFHIGRTVIRNWQEATDVRDKLLLAGGITAVVGIGAHHLVDISAMSPANAITALFVLVMVLYRPSESPPLTDWRGRVGAGVIGALWLALLVTGAWSTSLYLQYTTILHAATESGNNTPAGDELGTIIERDPSLALYHHQQGMLYGLAAAHGDTGALPKAIAAFERFVAIEPEYAMGWANLGALYWQAGQQMQALDAMRQAVDRAPEAAPFAFTLGTYLEAIGDINAAQDMYRASLDLAPDSALLPAWDETPLRRDLSRDVPLSSLARIVRAIQRRDYPVARALYRQAGFDRANAAPVYVIAALLALSSGDWDVAYTALDAAAAVAITAEDEAWVLYGQSRIAAYSGDIEASRAALARARTIALPGDYDPDYPAGQSIPAMQFVRLALPRQFLPQLNYPSASPVLLSLLEPRDSG